MYLVFLYMDQVGWNWSVLLWENPKLIITVYILFQITVSLKCLGLLQSCIRIYQLKTPKSILDRKCCLVTLGACGKTLELHDRESSLFYGQFFKSGNNDWWIVIGYSRTTYPPEHFCKQNDLWLKFFPQERYQELISCLNYSKRPVKTQ